MRLARGAGVAAMVVLALGGCDGGSRTSGSEPTASSAAPSASVTAFETFSGLRLPPEAEDVRLTRGTTEQGEPRYRATFTLPSAQTRAFCAGIGGQLPGFVGDQLREIFGYTGPDATAAICQDSLPADPRIQRRVLVVGTDRPQATVDVIAYRMPVR